MSKTRRTSFIVRVVRRRRGQVSGVVERAATGAKEAFQGVEAIGTVIAGMLGHEAAGPPAGADTRRAPSEAPSRRLREWRRCR